MRAPCEYVTSIPCLFVSETWDGHFVFCSLNHCFRVVSWWTFPKSFHFQSKVICNMVSKGLKGLLKGTLIRIILIESGIIFAIPWSTLGLYLLSTVQSQGAYSCTEKLQCCSNNRVSIYFLRSDVYAWVPHEPWYQLFTNTTKHTCDRDRKWLELRRKKNFFRFLFSSVKHLNQFIHLK